MVIYILFYFFEDAFLFWRFCFHLFILPCKNFCILSFNALITGCVAVAAATAVTAVTDAATKTSCDGKGILGKGGKCIFGGGFSVVCTSFVPSGLRKSLGGTTKG
jgi:hypothetical protein